MIDKQKAKFNGAPNQIFTIGRKAFPSGVWIVITPDELSQLSERGIYKVFDFNPPIDFNLIDIGISKIIKEDLPVKKAKKRKTKSKKEEGDL